MTYEEAFPTPTYHPITVTMAKKKKGNYDIRPFEAQVFEFEDGLCMFVLDKVKSNDYDHFRFRFEDCLIEYDGHKYFCTIAGREGYPKHPVLTAKLVA